MVAVVIALCAVVALVGAAALVGRRRLRSQRALTATADELAATRSTELERSKTALGAAEAAQAEAERRAAEATAAGIEATEQARLAVELAAAADTASVQAREDAAVAAREQDAAEQRATAAERRAAEAAGTDIDPHVLWALERSRSERTWRISVAPSPHVPSVFAEAQHPLLEALRVEVDAIREEVGTVVELDADLPDDITAAGSLLTLRAAQELLASVVRRSEETLLRVRAVGRDIVLTIIATDERDEPVALGVLSIPPSLGLELTDGGALVRGAIIVVEP
jgi:hypothetical protein